MMGTLHEDGLRTRNQVRTCCCLAHAHAIGNAM
jgi:hypothetical protein